jgi:OHCU decarboxylase
MLAQRPFKDAAELADASERFMDELTREDWLEAFRAHPRIGEREAASSQGPDERRWSSEEQGGLRSAGAEVRESLAHLQRAYEERFGHIYIVCASGKRGEEMLELLRRRMSNGPEDELRVAAGEQRRITRLRLEKLLSL